MNILYVCHNTYFNELSGVPLITKQYANAALKKKFNVAILTPAASVDNKLNKFTKDGFFFYNWPFDKDWHLDPLSKILDTSFTKTIKFDFKPDIIHIIDWIGIRSDIFIFLEKLKAPILKHVLNFEDICYFTSPIFNNEDKSPCKPTVDHKTCASCIFKNTIKKRNLFRKLLDNFILNNKKFISSKLLNRNDKMKSLIEKYFDQLIFPSKSFADFYLSHINVNKKFNIQELGVKKKEIQDNNKTNQSINFIFIGGASERKGWDLIQLVFNEILKRKKYNINLRIYGHKKKTSKSILKKYNSVEFFDSFNEEELYHILNWADIGLVPSYFEGYCKVLREFIECGLVPITTDFFGSEIIKDNFNGIVIQKPYYDNMLKSILRLLDDITLLSKYKNNIKNTSIVYEDDELRNIFDIYNKLKK